MTHHVAVPLQGLVSVSVAQVAQAHVPLLHELLNHVTYCLLLYSNLQTG